MHHSRNSEFRREVLARAQCTVARGCNVDDYGRDVMSHYATPTAQHMPMHSSPHIHLTKSSHVHHVLRRQSPHIDSHATHSTQAWRKLALLHHANSLCAIQAKVRDTTCNGQRQHAPLCTPPPMSVNVLLMLRYGLLHLRMALYNRSTSSLILRKRL